ncbi:disease resistance protein RUN1-like [Tripterygium wilfordii]|uniref:disease resistance protein RUN1-like n=1 Tax=Tripterygium wilfordii TaxID=458696 RepID=UPI0018F85FD3|nr:disease resistance protein RUN1-like [Tripterygium wilfordii]
MAASSSSSSSQGKYDVFISFRGTDTRDNITSHVYAALCSARIKTFIDNDLRRGDDVSDALLKTIVESKISVVIFSENYASSRWCLDELTRIMECNKENGQIIIPVFFKVGPSHVRNQSGPFGQALARYVGHPKIETWRDALTKAANLSGWDSQVTRPEATLIKSIVTDVLGKLYYISSSNFGNLVGMSSHFEQIESLLNMISEDVRIVGLWGMGGIGKTTLARAFFNYNFSKFAGYCIIEDIRETCEKRGLNELRDKLVIGILRDENLNVGTPNLGISFISDRLRRKKVLIILDDVDDSQHIELLVGQRDCLGPGSIVIITSRDKQVLKNGVDIIYDVPELDYSESLCLFSRYAFKQELPLEGQDMRLSNRAINYAKGHPLALKILGSYLCERSKQEQESALKKLEGTPYMAVQQVLRISYDGLDHQEKNLFLNIACFFKGENVDEVKHFHDACNYFTDIGLAVLIDKSLITIQKGRVKMHDLLQEMGRQIVREESIEEPGERSRLWDCDDICHVLTNNTGTVAIKGISLDMCEPRYLSINPGAFRRMRNLEFLKMRGHLSTVYIPQGLNSLSSKLRYMEWEQCPLKYLPTNFRPENLVRLIMPNSHVERLWNGKNLVHLEVIDLSSSKKLIEIPDLSLATNLYKLNLDECSLIKEFPEVSLEIQYLILSGTAIEDVPSTICNLKSLKGLDLGECRRLKNLPTSIYKLKPSYFGMHFPLKKREHQQEVSIHLRELTDLFVWLSSVEILNLSGNNFQKIPVAIKQLTNLICLNLKDCKRLQSLPQLPPHWRSDELFCLVFCVVLECNNFPNYCSPYCVNYNCHTSINRARGDSYSAIICERFIWRSQKAFRSDQVILNYDQSWINYWRMIPEEADDVDEISIEFDVEEDARNYFKVKGCGFHLLYTHDIENRHDHDGHVVVPPNSPCSQFSLNQDCMDEESAIQDAKDDGGYNVGNPVEVSSPVRSRKTKRKLKLKTLGNFIKSRWFRGKSTQKELREAPSLV